MVRRRIEKIQKFKFDIKRRAGKKIPHTDGLLSLNTKDSEPTVFLTTLRRPRSKAMSTIGV